MNKLCVGTTRPLHSPLLHELLSHSDHIKSWLLLFAVKKVNGDLTRACTLIDATSHALARCLARICCARSITSHPPTTVHQPGSAKLHLSSFDLTTYARSCSTWCDDIQLPAMPVIIVICTLPEKSDVSQLFWATLSNLSRHSCKTFALPACRR